MTRITISSIVVLVPFVGIDAERTAALDAEMCAFEGRELEFRVGFVAVRIFAISFLGRSGARS